MTARVAALAVALIAALGLAGCTSPPSEPDDPPPASRSGRPPAAQGPQDRDREAVLAALRQLDPCALVEAAMAATPALSDTRLRTDEPFRCWGAGPAGTLSVQPVTLDWMMRISLPSRALGGAKAYVQDEGGTCDTFLPVSFDLAIRFSYSSGDGSDACRVVSDLAAASSAVLADPEAVRMDPMWDACTLLADALDLDANQTTLGGAELSSCAVLSAAPRRGGITFDPLLHSEGRPETVTIGGRQVQRYEDEEACDIRWSQGPFGARFADSPDFQVLVTAPGCDRSTELAEAVIGLLDGPPRSDAEPQRPLLYAPDEPDSPFPGACAYVDVSNPKRCEPYREAAVPSDPAKIPTAAGDDANVLCTMAADAVSTHFGPRPRPVAVQDSQDYCYFVVPERSMQIGFTVTFRPARSDPGDRRVTVAGHPGVVASGAGHHRYRVSSSPSPDGEEYTVEFTVTAGPVNDDAPLPPGTDAKAEAALADILRTYFS